MYECETCQGPKEEERVIRFIRPNPVEPGEYRRFAGRCGDCGDVAIVKA